MTTSYKLLNTIKQNLYSQRHMPIKVIYISFVYETKQFYHSLLIRLHDT
jgi:hypothetical protein